MSYQSLAEELGAIKARLDKLEQAQPPEPTPDSEEWHYEIRIMHGDKKEYGWHGGVGTESVFLFCVAAQYLADAAGAGSLGLLRSIDVNDPAKHFRNLDYEGYPKP